MSKAHTFKSLGGYLAIAGLALASASATAAPHREQQNRWAPNSFFLQLGTGDEKTNAYSLGATWDWNWARTTRFGQMTGYTEATIGRWQTDNVGSTGTRWFTQFGATPVLRLYPAKLDGRWFSEIGIGANYITPVYHAGSKNFSTEFNFGDHIAIGRILDNERLSSVALRFQHFSNGGIDEPNPGENFTQLRYSVRF
jgi:lipid A 3-O-deacylase